MKIAKRKHRRQYPSISLLAQKAKKRFCITATDEAGWREYLWFPPCVPESLESLWQGIPLQGDGNMRESLGGEWYCRTDWPPEYKREFMRLWYRHQVPGRYTASVCCDDDSYLQAPDGRVILHAGCSEEFRATELPRIEARYPKWKDLFYNGKLKRKRDGRSYFPLDRRRERALARKKQEQ